MADFQQGVIAFAVNPDRFGLGIIAAGGPAHIVSKLVEMGEGWRLSPFGFTAGSAAIFLCLVYYHAGHRLLGASEWVQY